MIFMKLPLWLGHVAAAILSVLAGFFGVLNVLFSDVFGFSQQLGAIAYVAILYFILSLGLHGLWSGRRWTWFWWLVIPGGLFGILMSFDDMSEVFYPLGVLFAMILGAWLGKWVLRSRASKPVTP